MIQLSEISFANPAHFVHPSRARITSISTPSNIAGADTAAKKRPTSATQILFNRFYRSHPDRIAGLKKTRDELALGRQIRALREERGLSQAQLAKALRTQAPAISRIEDADYDGHSLRILRKIADYFEQHLVVSFEPKRPQRPGKAA